MKSIIIDILIIYVTLNTAPSRVDMIPLGWIYFEGWKVETIYLGNEDDKELGKLHDLKTLPGWICLINATTWL